MSGSKKNKTPAVITPTEAILESISDGNVLDHLDLRPEDRVGMMGHFGPLVDAVPWRARARAPRPAAGVTRDPRAGRLRL